MLAANATIRHQLEPWAARLREDQPHLLAARRARQFGHSEIRTGRSRSGGWLHRRLTYRGIRNATNMMILSASARIWNRATTRDFKIGQCQSAPRSGRRRELQAKMADENISILNGSPAVPRVGQRNGRLTIAVMMMKRMTAKGPWRERLPIEAAQARALLQRGAFAPPTEAALILCSPTA